MFGTTPSPRLSEALCSWPTFERRLSALLHSGQDHTLLYLDIDCLAVADDDLSDEALADVLRHVIPLLSVEMREHDHLIQINPQCVAILLADYSVEQALQLARVLRTKMQHSFFTQHGRLVGVGVSIGLVSLKHPYDSFRKAIETAANACQIAKSKGYNCIHLHQPKTSLNHVTSAPVAYQTV